MFFFSFRHDVNISNDCERNIGREKPDIDIW